MEFHDNQWYKGRDGHHPVKGKWVQDPYDDNTGEIHWQELGWSPGIVPKTNTFADFASFIAYLDSPMTEEQVQLYAVKMREHYEKNK